jgi:hypothetical protein
MIAPSFDPSDFSTDNYFRLLQIFSSGGYENVDFSTVDPSQKHLILRHDIDFDLEAAAKLADLENRNGYRAIYFVLLTSEFYNPFTDHARHALASIAASGHELGLHFDTSIHDANETNLSDAAKTECSILEQLLGQDVEVISMHRPPAALVGKNINFANRLNAYAPRFTKEMGYCSDSRGAWHYGPPTESEAFQCGTALQLLTHPIWWISAGNEPHDKCVDVLDRRNSFLQEEMERNCSAYTP